MKPQEILEYYPDTGGNIKVKYGTTKDGSAVFVCLDEMFFGMTPDQAKKLGETLISAAEKVTQ